MSLVLRDIRHSYGSGLVVDGASLEAAPGEIVTLFGPSGCGKTTLLRVAAGLETLQEGAVELDGKPLANTGMRLPPEKRPIGFVFQDFVLFPHLTIAGNIAFGLSELSSVEREARIASELAAVDLGDFAARYPHQLSGGQQQRAALARAFARHPRAMLLDEPFASIDVALRQKLRAEMRRLLKERSTPTILVTHDPSEAIELGDRVAVMRAGRIVEMAAPERLFNAPKTLGAAMLFPGSQSLACAPTEKGVSTVFGEIAPLARSPGAAFVVIHAGGVSAVRSDKSEAKVADCRFEGPDWLIAVAHPNAHGVVLKAKSSTAIAPGAPVDLRFDPAYLRVLAS